MSVLMKCETCGGTGEKADPEALRIQRELAGLAQGEVARRMGLHQSYLSDLEQGRRDWNSSLLTRFTAALRKTNHKRK